MSQPMKDMDCTEWVWWITTLSTYIYCKFSFIDWYITDIVGRLLMSTNEFGYIRKSRTIKLIMQS